VPKPFLDALEFETDATHNEAAGAFAQRGWRCTGPPNQRTTSGLSVMTWLAVPVKPNSSPDGFCTYLFLGTGAENFMHCDRF
jgi:hypothetical protein